MHTFSVGVLGNLFSRVGSGGMPYLIPLMMQVALGYSPMHAGMMMIPAALAGMFSKRIVVPLVRLLGYRRVLVGNTLLVGVAMASFALVQPGLPLWVHVVQFAFFGAVNSLQFTAMNTLALRDLDGGLASSGNSLLSMVMMLAMSLGVAVAGGSPGSIWRRWRRAGTPRRPDRLPLEFRLRWARDDDLGRDLRAAGTDAQHSASDRSGSRTRPDGLRPACSTARTVLARLLRIRPADESHPTPVCSETVYGHCCR